MHFYKFHIGDYACHTRHLTPMEDLVYRRLLDAYYIQEYPLNTGIAAVARQIGLRDCQIEVEAVLSEFFVLTDAGWTNTRADKEIAQYRALCESGKVAAAKRWQKGDAMGNPLGAQKATDADPMLTTNHEPLTNNQEPIGADKSAKKKRATRYPEDFTPTDAHNDLATELGVNLAVELPQFRDYHTAKGSTFVSWNAALNTWIRNSQKFRVGGGSGGAKGGRMSAKDERRQQMADEIFGGRNGNNGNIIDGTATRTDSRDVD